MKTLLITIFLALVCAIARADFTDVIGGEEVAGHLFPEVSKILVEHHGVGTAVLVGPRTLLTAAHNGTNSSEVTAELGGKSYPVRLVRSPLYPQADHDLAVLISEVAISHIAPIKIGSQAVLGENVTLIGYGCTSQLTGEGVGTLRMGFNAVHSFSGYDFLTRPLTGHVQLCSGDSGGPVLRESGAERYVVGIASKGRIGEPISYFVDLRSQTSEAFLTDIAETYELELCGLNSEC